MIDFHETSRALFDFNADTIHTGTHIASNPRRDRSGMTIGRADFDFNRDSLSRIDPFSDPFSIFDEVSPEMPEVEINMPYSSLVLNVIVDIYSLSRFPEELKSIDEKKRRLMIDIAECIFRAASRDDSRLFVLLGDNDSTNDLALEEAYSEEVGSPEGYFSRVDDISSTGDINFLFSDFSGFGDGIGRLPELIVPVKYNHPIELELPKNAGIIPFGETKECNTNSPKDLKRANQGLQRAHHLIMSSLSRTGHNPISVVYDQAFEEGFNVTEVDEAVAEAIRDIQRQKS
jgi:hypothetical protein